MLKLAIWKLAKLSLVALFFSLQGVQAQATAINDYHYTGQVIAKPNTGFIKADWKIQLLSAPKQNISFALRDTLTVIKVAGPIVKSSSISSMGEGSNLNQIDIELNTALPVKEHYISISYQGVLLPTPMTNRINHIGNDYIELNIDSFWFPINNEFNKLLTTEFTFSTGDKWQAISTGEVQINEQTAFVKNSDPFIDIAITLAPHFKKTKGNGYQLYDLRTKDNDTAILSDAANHCYSFLNQTFGKTSPLPNAHFILHNRPESGYARKGYIALSSINKFQPEDLTGFVCHELSHFWSSYGKFDTVENWLNESFAVYAELMAIRSIYGDQAYQSNLKKFSSQIENKNLPPIWTKEDQSRKPYLVNYRKGPLAIAALEKKLGRDKFLPVIQRYMNEKVQTTPQLFNIVEEVAGKESRAWFAKKLAE